ncbi:hypothetical protein OSB04_un001076 [Centaurea solstitialis]|uniref:Uncharacterized protein n=1 Tax=Centaurea solstitialis TaxID=347529 RepID=A0AA38W5A9_9ASTR|nr:hypothetical protein OSB04_un001076 [Centaurea solstitialis]
MCLILRDGLNVALGLVDQRVKWLSQSVLSKDEDHVDEVFLMLQESSGPTRKEKISYSCECD